MNVYQEILNKLAAGEAVALETGIRGESGSIEEDFSRRLTDVTPKKDLKGRMVAAVTSSSPPIPSRAPCARWRRRRATRAS